MAMDLVKEEAAWEAEYVEALWEALYAVHHQAKSQATDVASPVARACAANTSDPQPKTETPDPGVVSTSHRTLKGISTNIPTKTKPVQGVQDIPTSNEEAGVANAARTPEPVPNNVSTNQDSKSKRRNGHYTEVTQNPRGVSNTHSVLEDVTNQICKTEPVWAPQEVPNSLEDAIVTNVVRTPAPTANVSTNQPSLEDSNSNNRNAAVTRNPNNLSSLEEASNIICKPEPVWTPQDVPNSPEDAIVTNVVRTPSSTYVPTNQPSLEDSSSNNAIAAVTRNPNNFFNTHSSLEEATNKKCKAEPVWAPQDVPNSPEDAIVTNVVRTPAPTADVSINQPSLEDSNSNNRNAAVTRNPNNTSSLEEATNKICKPEPVWAPQDVPNSPEGAIVTNVVRTPAPTDVSTNQPSLDDSSSNNPNAAVTRNPNNFFNTHPSMLEASNKICKAESVWAPQDVPNSPKDAIVTNVARTPAPTDVSTNQPSLKDSNNNNRNAAVTRNPNNLSSLEEAANIICKTEPVWVEDISNGLEDDSVSDIFRTPASPADVSTTHNYTIYNTDLARSSAKVPSSVEESSNKMCKDLGIVSFNLEDTSNNVPNKEVVQNADVSLTNSDDGDADVNKTARTDCKPEGIAASLQDPSFRKTSSDAPKVSEVSRLQTPDVSTGTAVPKSELISLTPCYVKLEHVSCKKAFICQICQRFFSYKQHLMNHILSHTQDEINTIKIEKKVKRKGKFVCHICGNGVKSKQSMTRHLKIHERDPFREQMNRKTPKDVITKIYYNCDYCGLSTVRKYGLIRHIKRHAKEQAIACEICHQQFQATWEYVDHMKHKTCQPYKSSSERTNKNNLQNQMVKPCYVSLERINIGNKVKTTNIKIIDEFKSFNSDSEDLLDDNQAFETDEETYYCGVCEEQFDTLASLGDHICHRTKKPFSCDICKKKFRFQNSLVEHVRLHTGEKPYICDVCKKQFRLKHKMSIHIRTVHLGEQAFSCKVCKKKFRRSETLRKHVRKHTGEKEKKLYSCKVCKKRFRFERECVEHGRVHTGEKPFRCTFCNMSFRVEVALRIHSRVHTGEKPYTCDVCKRSFRIWQTLDAHKRVHTGEKPFSCDVCNKQFRRFDTLYIHKRIHTGEKPYACEFCPKRFTQRAHLKTHRRTHTGEKPYSCSVCNKSFIDNSHLRNHARTHSAERPYPCNLCEKTFKNAQDLKVHHRIHTGQKPYECKVCKKKCTQASNLWTHMKTHGKKSWPFSCNVCEKKFQRRQSLNQHLMLHDAHTPFMCDVCGAQFSSSTVLSVHARSHYGGE